MELMKGDLIGRLGQGSYEKFASIDQGRIGGFKCCEDGSRGMFTNEWRNILSVKESQSMPCCPMMSIEAH